jgi:hypothetical protein
MASEGSITGDIRKLPARDPDAAQRLWEAYFQRLVGRAQAYLRTLNVPEDAEDVALSAFKSIVLRARDGRFARLEDRDDLWRLLVFMTWQKAVDRKRYAVRHPATNFSGINLPDGLTLEDVLGESPVSPESVLSQLRELLDCLDERLRRVAQLKLQRYKNWEIAREIGRAEVTVRRNVAEISERWAKLTDMSWEGP